MANGKTATLTRKTGTSEVQIETETKETDPKLPIVSPASQEPEPAASLPQLDTPVAFQKHALKGGPGEDKINVQLYINTDGTDGIRWYDEALPVSVVQAILDPRIEDFFIPIAGTSRMKSPRSTGHYLHT